MSVERPPQRRVGWVQRAVDGFRPADGPTHGPKLHVVDVRHAAALTGERRARRSAPGGVAPSIGRSFGVWLPAAAVPGAVLAASALALAGGRAADALAAGILVVALVAAALERQGRLGLPEAYRRELGLALTAVGAMLAGAVTWLARTGSTDAFAPIGALLLLALGGAVVAARLADRGAWRRWAALVPWLGRNGRAVLVGLTAGSGIALLVLTLASRAGGVALQSWLVLAVTVAWVPVARAGLLASLRAAVLDGDAGPLARKRVRELLAGFAGPYAVLALLPWIMGAFGDAIASFCGLGAVLALAFLEGALGQQQRAAAGLLAAGALVALGVVPGAVLACTFAWLLLDLLVLGRNVPRLGVLLLGADVPADRVRGPEVPGAR